MIKKYFSSNDLSFNIRVNGVRKRIVFDMLTTGGSEYVTDSPDIQRCIESHSGYGTLFKMVEAEAITKQMCSDESTELQDVPDVMNCADALEWLKNRGVKGLFRSKTAIISAASEIGYTFSGLR